VTGVRGVPLLPAIAAAAAAAATAAAEPLRTMLSSEVLLLLLLVRSTPPATECKHKAVLAGGVLRQSAHAINCRMKVLLQLHRPCVKYGTSQANTLWHQPFEYKKTTASCQALASCEVKAHRAAKQSTAALTCCCHNGC
jgi:hypothetical protein